MKTFVFASAVIALAIALVGCTIPIPPVPVPYVGSQVGMYGSLHVTYSPAGSPNIIFGSKNPVKPVK